MALNAKKVTSASKGTGPSQDPIPAGSYPVRLVQVLDLGLQAQRPYQGKEKPPAHEIMLSYEFLDEFCLDENGNEQTDKPRFLSETMPLHSLNADRARSTQRYYALDPSEDHDGDFVALLGTPAVATVTTREHEGRTYNNISAIAGMRPKDAAKAPELVNEPKSLDLDDPDVEVFGSLPEWVQTKIKKGLEFRGSVLDLLLGGKQQAADNTQEDDNDDEEWT